MKGRETKFAAGKNFDADVKIKQKSEVEDEETQLSLKNLNGLNITILVRTAWVNFNAEKAGEEHAEKARRRAGFCLLSIV